MLSLQPISQREANAFIAEHHRHHKPPQGYKFAIAVNDGEKVVGVITVGRPIARHLDNGYTAEVTRCCVQLEPKVPNACSMLYAAAWRASKAMGYTKLITYVLASESGGSLKASGWKVIGERGGGSWNSKSRPRVDKHPTELKTLWSKAA